VSQTTIMFGALMIAFIVFVTVHKSNGSTSDLSAWLSIFGL